MKRNFWLPVFALATTAVLTTIPASAATQMMFQNIPNTNLGLPDLLEVGDRMGEVMATGNFNCDGFMDLVVGVPTEESNTGAVLVIYGSATGLVRATAVRLTGTAIGDKFGTALATGDFNGDSCGDFAVGAPGFSTGTGRVYVYYGTTAASLPAPVTVDSGFGIAKPAWGQTMGAGHFSSSVVQDQLVIGAVNYLVAKDMVAGWQNSILSTVCEVKSIATGDFYGFGYDALVYGCPALNASKGAIFKVRDVVLAPSATEINTSLLSADTSGDKKGTSLAAGRFDPDGYDDLAVGIPGENAGAGAIILKGGWDGPTLTNGLYFTQNSTGVPDSEENGDSFGASLLAVDWNLDLLDDLLVGVPLEDVNGKTNTGLMQAFVNNGTTMIPGSSYRQHEFMAEPSEALAEFSFAAVTGDFDGNGLPDVALSGPGYPTAGVSQSGLINIVLH